MKKIVTLCLFAFALILCTQTTQAQAKVAANNTEEAVQKTKELTSLFKLDKNSINNAYEIFSNYENKLKSLEAHFDINSTDFKRTKSDLDETLTKDLSNNVLTTEQLNRYTIFLEQKLEKRKS